MLPDQPKISVIIPSFNQGQFIEETIFSIVNQSYPNIEIIIIDGGSTDNTINIIKKHELNLFFWLSEKDSGQSEAINKGIKKATGDIITWLNSDDVYEKNTLQLVANEFVNTPSIGLLHGKSLLFGANIKNKVIGPKTDLTLVDYLPYMRFPQPSSFFSKKAFDAISPVNNELHFAMDFELVVKLILNGFKPKQSPALLSRYRMHPQSKSNNDMAFLAEWTEVFINLLHSLPNGEPFIHQLGILKIDKKNPVQKYPCFITLADPELKNIFLQHLNLHFHYHYRAFNYSDCKKISGFLKEFYTQFYIDNQYKKFMNRLKFVPKFIFSLVRNF